MAEVRNGRFTAEIDDDFVVFVIGMRINHLRKLRAWTGPFLAMPRMLRELEQHPETGLLHAHLAIGGRTIAMTQYWRSFDHLEAYAKNPDATHLPAWRRFNQRVGASGDVGIFHETYRVGPGAYETIYANMPVLGLAAAGRSVPIGRRRDTARRRLTDASSAEN